MHKLIRFISKLRDYLPILWDDEDYDFDYMLQVLQVKIKRMRCHFQTCPMGGIHPNQVKRIKLAEHLISRLLKGDYCRYEHNEWWNHDRDNEEKLCRIMKTALYLEDCDWNNLFDLIKKHGQRWWD